MMRRNNDKVQRLSARYDKYVYLTRQMDDFYHAGDGNYMVMEGLIDVSGIHDAPPADIPGKEIILYTAHLRRIFGVMNLVEAFQKGGFKRYRTMDMRLGECAELLQAKAEEETAESNISVLSTLQSTTIAARGYNTCKSAWSRRNTQNTHFLQRPLNISFRETR